MKVKKIHVDEPFLYDLHQLAFNADKLYKQLRNLRTVVQTADERWAKATHILNKEAAKRQERKPFIEDIERTLRDFNVALYTLDEKNDAPWSIDLYELVNRWKETNS